jgi:anti-sigma factor RsiW
MKNNCSKWKERLLEAVLTETTTGELQEHLLACADCARELAALQARRKQLDALLPLLVRGAGPAPEFRARVLAATHAQDAKKSRRSQRWPVWVLAVTTSLVAVALMIAIMLNRRTTQITPSSELAMAEKLAQWSAPSDTLLATPGPEILRTMPKLGDLYLEFPVKTDKEK